MSHIDNRKYEIASTIEYWEGILEEVPRISRAWSLLAHARHEWSIGMYSVAQRDIDLIKIEWSIIIARNIAAKCIGSRAKP